MSRGINKVILVATLGADPDVRYTQGGNAITSIRVATNESWTDKQSGEKQERTEWHRVKFFGKLAEIAGEYLRKGSQVYIEGSLRTEKYTDKDGIERFSTDIIGNEMQMLGGRPSGNDGERPAREAPRGQSQQQNRSAGGQRHSPPSNSARSAPPASRAPAPQPAFAGGFDDSDPDSVPF